MTDNVASLFGGPTGQREVNQFCIDALEAMLQKAKAGEVIGVAMACMYHDGLAAYEMGGMIGGYPMLGALEITKMAVIQCMHDE